jgi:hypothetical protein
VAIATEGHEMNVKWTPENIHIYVGLAEREIATRKLHSEVLQGEVARSRHEIDALQLRLQEYETTVIRPQEVKRVSEFEMDKTESGGTVHVLLRKESNVEEEATTRRACQRRGCCNMELLYDSEGSYVEYQTECQSVRLRRNVVLQKTSTALSLYTVHLSKFEPCPSPQKLEPKRARIESDPAYTMCDIWNTWTDHEEIYQRRERRTAKKKRTRLKQSLIESFGTYTIPEHSTLFHAALGFLAGSQDGDDDNRVFVRDYIKRLDKIEHDGKVVRASKAGRKELLTQMVTYMFDGEVAKQLEENVIKKKRFSTVKLARVSDMHSSFNPSSLGAIASCEGGKEKGEMGLLCAETTLRRCMDHVLLLARNLGFYSMPLPEEGKIWCWGDATGILRTAIYRYVKTIYYDACCDSANATAPWIVPLSGDGVRTSQRGTFVTVMGPKLADPRLVQQSQTMKTTCQSRDMYTPAVAGYVDECTLMPYFHHMVAEFLRIEEQQFCEVNGQKYPVYLQIAVVADLSFLHKYTQRGGGSHSSTCFCMLCGALRNFKHYGYPGGCRDCRARGVVYGADGVQICLHYEACTCEFLKWQQDRYETLKNLIPEFPLTSLPAWDDVARLREECLKRCVGPLAGWHARISKQSGKNKMTASELSDWIMKATRDDATLSNSEVTGVMFCPINVVTASLRTRKVPVYGRFSNQQLRVQLRAVLQLEQEYTRMTLHMKDDRFGPEHASAKAISVSRLILCTLHLPMRTHEKVLTLLFQEACQNRSSKICQEILGEMAVIIRRLGRLKDTWSFKWNTKSNCVEKVKMHWDQSKRIFTARHTDGLRELVRLAVPLDEQANWDIFLKQYIEFIDLLTVSRDYTPGDIELLDKASNETYRLLITHCGGKDAVTNYFHYIGAGHVTWMCRAYGNIWRYRNEGVEAYNKVLSKRANMFNSSGNRGNVSGKGNVFPFEVLGKWMSRYAMWQLDFANDLFATSGTLLGIPQICYDVTEELWEYKSDVESDSDDEQYISDNDDCSEYASDSDLEPFLPADHVQCVFDSPGEGARYSFRKREK